MTRYFSLLIAFAGFLLQALPGQASPRVVLESRYLHLRNVGPREWSSFPEKADADRIEIQFDLQAPESFRLLTWRQEGINQVWWLELNGQRLTKLIRDHNHMEQSVLIPDGLLKASANALRISSDSTLPNDVRIGDIALRDAAADLVNAQRAEQLLQQRGLQRAVPMMQATIHLSAMEDGRGLPCRFTILDAETGALVFIGAESDDHHAVREGVVYALDGRARIQLAGDAEHPRHYHVYCGRGFEYSLGHKEIVVDGSETTQSVSFSLHREVPTPGLVSCDPHLHTFEFDRHGDCSLTERLITLAGEGIELAPSATHNQYLDYGEEATRIGAARWLTPVIGCEVTTHVGHFTAFPIDADAPLIDPKLRTWLELFPAIYATPRVKVCILNHGRDIHNKFRPLDPENFDSVGGVFKHRWRLEVNAMELINSGAHQSDPQQVLRDWFAMLRSGHRIAGIGGSDSHTVNFAIPGQARTYLEAPDEDPAAIHVETAVASILQGRTWVSFGLLTRLDLAPDGKTATVQVLGPGWTRAERLQIFRNGEEVASLAIPDEAAMQPGVKLTHTFPLDQLKAEAGDFLCAVAIGPGLVEGWWAIKPPYQPISPDFTPYVMGISPAVWLE